MTHGLRTAAISTLASAILLGTPAGAGAGEEGDGPPPIEPVKVSEITAIGVEATRAHILAEEINAILDTLPTLKGYETWRATVQGEGRAELFLGDPMAVSGVARLSSEDLHDWSLVRFRMLSHLMSADGEALDGSTASKCARVARGQEGQALKVELYNALEPEIVRLNAELHARGLIAMATEPPPPQPSGEEVREAIIALAEAVRGPAVKPIGSMTHPERYERAGMFEDIVASELKADGSIEDDGSACVYTYLFWNHFPALDVEERRAAFHLHLRSLQAAMDRQGSP